MTNPASDGTLFMPPQASTIAGEIDTLYYFIFYLSVFFFVLLAGGAVYFLFKYRRREGGPEAVPIHHNTFLELLWSLGPLVILIIIFAWGFKGYLSLAVAPRDSMEIHVYGSRWKWEFEYANGTKSPGDLRVPVGRNVKLIMTSTGDPKGNVLHSFFIPAFRVKADVLPNRYNTLWFQATRTGTFQVFCTEYCGDSHSAMLATVIVMEPDAFKKWLEEGDKPPEGEPLAAVGKKLFVKNACSTCHKDTPENPAVTGPSLIGAFGRTDNLIDGTTVQIDENYIRESILQPAAKIVAGYALPGVKPPMSAMPAFQGSLKDWQVNALIEYIKTLK